MAIKVDLKPTPERLHHPKNKNTKKCPNRSDYELPGGTTMHHSKHIASGEENNNKEGERCPLSVDF